MESGVGTEIEIASHSASRAMSVVASRRPVSSASASSASVTSSMWLRPAFTPSTTTGSMSNPTARSPERAISTERGRPT